MWQAGRRCHSSCRHIPPPRYTRDEPEISAWLRRGTEPPDYTSSGVASTTIWPTSSHRRRLRPLPRRHPSQRRRTGTTFPSGHVRGVLRLSGTIKLYDGADWLDGRQGDFLYVPPGGIHGFRNEADEPASILMLFAPGAPREHYFEGMADLADLTDDERRESFIRHDSFFIE